MTGKQEDLRVFVENGDQQVYLARANFVSDKHGRNLYVTGMKIPGYPSQMKYSRHATGSTNVEVTRIDGSRTKVARHNVRVPFASITEPECVWRSSFDVFEQPWGARNPSKAGYVLQLRDLPSHIVMVEHHLMTPEHAASFVASYDYGKPPIGLAEVATLETFDQESAKLLVTTILSLPPHRLDYFQRSISKTGVNVPRNSQCPCGRPSKFKRCHGLFTRYWWDNPLHSVLPYEGDGGDSVNVERIG